MKSIFLGFILLSTTFAFAQFETSYEKFEDYVLCKNAKHVRTLRINREAENGHCKTLYTKAGVDRVVGQGQSIYTCQHFLKNVRTNLEKAQWKCEEINQVRIYRGMKEPQPFDQ